MTTFALVDGNNFYVSCERVFNPKLMERPVVVLSNNDDGVGRFFAEPGGVSIDECLVNLDGFDADLTVYGQTIRERVKN